MVSIDPYGVGWSFVDGCAVIVHRTSGALHWLNHAGTEIWRTVVANSTDQDRAPGSVPFDALSAPERSEPFLSALQRAALVEDSVSRPVIDRGAVATMRPTERDRRAAPRLHRLLDVVELVPQIGPASETMVQRIGQGAALRAPDGRLFLLSREAEAVWRRLEEGPCAFVELLDLLCGELDFSDVEADERLTPLLRDLEAHGAIRGAGELLNRRVEHLRSAGQIIDQRSAGDVRPLGRLELMEDSNPPRSFPNLGRSPVIRDVVEPPRDVAIVCQYGIVGLADGIESYGQRCVRRLKTLNPDLIVLSGGGRHGLADVREAESVVERYLDHFPDTPLWVETHSGTSWANVQHSLELLIARSIVPRRVFLIGDRARTEKLRLSVWLARRRFPAFRDVSFRVIPVVRERVTWRDWRVMQVAVGLFQVLNESRTVRTALSADGA